MQKLRQKLYRVLAINRLKRRYDYLIEVEKLMEEYQTNLILSGGSDDFKHQTRQNLQKTQGSIKSMESMLDFLKKLK